MQRAAIRKFKLISKVQKLVCILYEHQCWYFFQLNHNTCRYYWKNPKKEYWSNNEVTVGRMYCISEIRTWCISSQAVLLSRILLFHPGQSVRLKQSAFFSLSHSYGYVGAKKIFGSYKGPLKLCSSWSYFLTSWPLQVPNNHWCESPKSNFVESKLNIF